MLVHRLLEALQRQSDAVAWSTLSGMPTGVTVNADTALGLLRLVLDLVLAIVPHDTVARELSDAAIRRANAEADAIEKARGLT
jgi:hypothetical protein